MQNGAGDHRKDRPERAPAAFGRRSAGAAPAPPPLPGPPSPPQAPPPAKPARARASAPLPLSSQQLQIFTGPMGARAEARREPAPEFPPEWRPPPAAARPPAAERRARLGGARARKIAAAIVGAILGLVGGYAVVEAGRIVGAAQRAAPMDLEGAPSSRPWKRYAGWPAGSNARFSNVAALRSPPRPAQPRKLGGAVAGDPAKGAQLVITGRGAANCLACHVIGDRGTDQPGNIGPDLSEIAKRGHTDEYLFNVVYDARVYNPDTVMPPWGTHGILSEEDVRNVVAYLKTLGRPAAFKSALDDPARRPVPKETRDNLDPMVNPGVFAIDKAKDLWSLKGPKGAACATCHHTPEPEVRFSRWAATMPRWDGRLEKVVGVEEFVARHAKAATGHAWPMDGETNVVMAMYLRHLANGATIAVDVTGDRARAAAERGKALMERKMGRLNLSCADCHSGERYAHRWTRGQWLTAARGYTVHFPTWRTSRSQLWDIRKRFQWCNVAIGADELPPDAKEYGDLELYLTSLSNGLRLSVPGIRP
jgi:sulfur-oxidizing protein SoxA